MISNKLTKTDNPPVEELQNIAKSFQQEYNLCRKKVDGPARRFILLKKDGSGGKYFSHFKTLHKVLQEFPDIDVGVFIKAQFHYRGLIQPFEMFDNSAMQYYVNYSSKKTQSVGIDELKTALENDKEFMWEQCRSWKIEPSLENYFTYRDEGALISKSAMLCMTMNMPSTLFLCNSETYRDILYTIPRDIRDDLPHMNDKDMKRQRSQYINNKAVLEYFKRIFTAQESII